MDGQVLVWSLVTCVTRRHLPGREESSVGEVEPRYTWTQHSLPVTGLHLGHGPAHMARVVSCSSDMTVKVFSMSTGDMLLSVSFTSALSCVVMDNLETSVWVGDTAGHIHRISLLSPPRDVCVSCDTCGARTLVTGHAGAVTRISLSADSLSLVSGDSGGGVHLWDTVSGQMIRSIPHKSGLTYLQFMLTPPALLDKDSWLPGTASFEL